MSEEREIVEEFRKVFGKRLVGIRLAEPLEGGFDLIFEDGSEIELYVDGTWGICYTSPEEAKEDG